MPKHRQKCFIYGWFPIIQGNATQCTQPGYWIRPADHEHPYWSTTSGGGCAIFYLSLDFLYSENKKWRNRWSSSNEGFDLARYYGTKFYLPPHDNFWLIVTYDSEFKDSNTSYGYSHPAIMLLTKYHKIVKPRKFGGKGKRFFVPPPSIYDTSWYHMKNWCGAALAKITVSLFNPYQGLMHTGQSVQAIKIGRQAQGEGYQPYSVSSGSNAPDIFYRWDWDDGEGNQVALPYARHPSDNPENWEILTWSAPYWLWFYGKGYNAFLGSVDSAAGSYLNVKIKWWPIKTDNEKGPHTDPKRKKWIDLYYTNQGQMLTNAGPATALRMAMFGPFCYATPDMVTGANYSIPLFYQSRWHWGGGISSAVAHVNNPCPDQGPRGVQVSDPRTVANYVLHPWDMDTTGYIEPAKFRQLLNSLDYRVPGAPESQKEEAGPSLRPPKPEDGEEEELSFFSGSSETESEGEDEETGGDPRWVKEKLGRIAAKLRMQHRKQREFGRGLLSILESKK